MWPNKRKLSWGTAGSLACTPKGTVPKQIPFIFSPQGIGVARIFPVNDGEEYQEFVVAMQSAQGQQVGDASFTNLVETLRFALVDAQGGLDYTRHHHGELYGVGFDRCEKGSAEAINAANEYLALAAAQPQGRTPELENAFLWLEDAVGDDNDRAAVDAIKGYIAGLEDGIKGATVIANIAGSRIRELESLLNDCRNEYLYRASRYRSKATQILKALHASDEGTAAVATTAPADAGKWQHVVSDTRKVNYGIHGVHLEAFDKVEGRWFTVGLWDGSSDGVLTPTKHFSVPAHDGNGEISPAPEPALPRSE
jgi:hypothetical protein